MRWITKPLGPHWRSLYVRQKKKWIVVGFINMDDGAVEIQRQRVYIPRARIHPYAGHDTRWSWKE